MRSSTKETLKNATLMGASVIAGVSILVGAIFGIAAGTKAYSRYQAVEDAQNKVKTSQIDANNQVEINRIRIEQQEQKVLIAEQDAEIRLKEAQGIREAQDVISETITPLYVQMEMVRALQGIAESGSNATVIYIPVGPDGLPVITSPDNQ